MAVPAHFDADFTLRPLTAAGPRSLGRHPVRLDPWGDSPETVAQYQALGFALAGHEAACRLVLRPPNHP